MEVVSGATRGRIKNIPKKPQMVSLSIPTKRCVNPLNVEYIGIRSNIFISNQFLKTLPQKVFRSKPAICIGMFEVFTCADKSNEHAIKLTTAPSPSIIIVPRVLDV